MPCQEGHNGIESLEKTLSFSNGRSLLKNFLFMMFVLCRLTLTGTELMVLDLPAEFVGNLLNVVLEPLSKSCRSIKIIEVNMVLRTNISLTLRIYLIVRKK